ncbi:MAG: RedB protein [Bryobacteraceae bacterium]
MLRLTGPVPLVAATILWASAVCFGVNLLMRYSTTPGQAAVPPAALLADLGVFPAQGRSTLLIFAHPQCPCSRATLGELAVIMAHRRGTVDAYVLFYSPESKGRDWVKGDLWRVASHIPGVRLMEDPEGSYAIRFGAQTSGQTMLYDPKGRLLFSGGITVSRGHAGANDGRDIVESLLAGGIGGPGSTAVFGCSLRGGS